MSNSPLVTYTRLSPNHTEGRTLNGKTYIIDTVTIHCVVGQLTAKGIVNLPGFTTYDPVNGSSCNYAVGKDGSIALCVEECNRSWCSGGKDKNGKPIYINGISGKINDFRAITIEVASDAKHPYAITDAAMEALISLLADICKRNPGIGRLRWKGDKALVGNVAEQNMTVHRWFANKACPGDYLYARHSEIATEVNRRLDDPRAEGNTADEPTDKAAAIYARLPDVPESYRPTIQKLMEMKALAGFSDPDPTRLDDNVLNLSEDFCRVMTVLNRLGVLEVRHESSQ